MARFRIIVLILSIALPSSAQNLVNNGDFEKFKNCPSGKGEIYYPGTLLIHDQTLLDWYSPTSGTPDYFNTCNSTNFEISIPDNYLGKELPHSGNGFAGIVLYTEELPNCTECKEYLQIKLNEPLVEGWVYNVSMFISLADNVKYAVSEIGIYFSADSVFNRASMTLKYVPQLYWTDASALKISSGWTSVSGSYTAKGGEQFLTVGNFIPSFKTNPEAMGKKKKILSSYYFIDDVLVSVLNKKKSPAPGITTFDSIPRKGETFVLKNIQFEPQKADLKDEANKELKNIANWILSHPKINIEIGGYTDNSGDEKSNLLLSELRAKAVYTYLIQEGVSVQNIKYKGYGPQNPIADNGSTEGREMNRRVELKVLD